MIAICTLTEANAEEHTSVKESMLICFIMCCFVYCHSAFPLGIYSYS